MTWSRTIPRKDPPSTNVWSAWMKSFAPKAPGHCVVKYGTTATIFSDSYFAFSLIGRAVLFTLPLACLLYHRRRGDLLAMMFRHRYDLLWHHHRYMLRLFCWSPYIYINAWICVVADHWTRRIIYIITQTPPIPQRKWFVGYGTYIAQCSMLYCVMLRIWPWPSTVSFFEVSPAIQVSTSRMWPWSNSTFN